MLDIAALIRLETIVFGGCILKISLLTGSAVGAIIFASDVAGAQTLSVPAAAQQPPYYVCTRNWYVDQVNGADSNSGLSPSLAFQTISKAAANVALMAGDCINVAPGTYNEFVYLRRGGNLNTLNGYVTLLSTQKWGAKIVGPSTNGYSTLTLASSYLIVDGFDVSGGANGGHCIDGGYDVAKSLTHHLIVVNNHAHNCGGGGIEMAGGDYYIIDSNLVDHNAATNILQTSGISVAGGRAADGLFTAVKADQVYYRNVIRNNISHDNLETFSCAEYGASVGCHTDGEGIIVDSYHLTGYTYRTLVEGNQVYNNGGNGIQVGRSDYVTVTGNTSHSNFRDVNNSSNARGELGNYFGSFNIWVNNIASANPGQGVTQNNVGLVDLGAATIGGVTYNNADVVWRGNVIAGGIRYAAPTVIPPGTNVSAVNPL